MFLGVIEPEVRSIVLEQSRSWTADDVYIGCSGNFTLERTLSDGKRRIHGNDVSIYTSALGWWLSGRDVPHRLKPDVAEELAWLEPYLDGGAGTIATLLLSTRFLGSFRKPNLYHRRMFQAHRDQFDALHDKTLQKLNKVELQLASYSAMDVREYLTDVVPADAAVATFPPYFTGGYEAMWKPLEDVFDWPAPTYPELDLEGIGRVIEQVMDRRHWFFGSNFRWEDKERYLRGVVQVGARRTVMYVYGSEGGARIVRPRQTITPVDQTRLAPGEELGSRLWLAPLSAAQFSWLRSQYLDPSIAPALPLFACAVMVDDRLIGAFGYSAPKYTPGQAYLMSDFAVAPTDYKRLSKLVLMAATSREAQLLCQRSMSRRLTTMLTTAFSQHAESMKYRGLLNLVKRGDCECAGKPHAYHLNYGGELGRWTLAEALTEWRRKHGQRRETAAVN